MPLCPSHGSCQYCLYVQCYMGMVALLLWALLGLAGRLCFRARRAALRAAVGVFIYNKFHDGDLGR